MKGYVLGFLFSEDRKHVVLIQKNKPEWQAGCLNGVGGKMEEGETPFQTMVREFEEETGAHFEGWRYFANMTNSQFIVYCFVGFAHPYDLKVESKTDEIVKTVKVEDILTNKYRTIDNLKWLITMALDKGFEPVTITYEEADKYKEPVK